MVAAGASGAVDDEDAVAKSQDTAAGPSRGMRRAREDEGSHEEGGEDVAAPGASSSSLQGAATAMLPSPFFFFRSSAGSKGNGWRGRGTRQDRLCRWRRLIATDEDDSPGKSAPLAALSASQ
jgi:hypothetical protein